ncbi:MAG: hypothetical protein JWN30_1981 [Bacilli bacterium]|nr:hypothetical protein [Bacilli bacterium]
MSFQGFDSSDFSLFDIPGLDDRMQRLKQTLRPKLTEIGEQLVPYLSELLQMPMHYHVAMHARRTTNPPTDSWVAWSHNPRGYKMFPHFQVGAWSTHVFIQWGIIYESPQKAVFGEKVKADPARLLEMVPAHFRWYPDHTSSNGMETAELTKTDLIALAERLMHVKKGELMVGVEVPQSQALNLSGADFLQLARETFAHLAPLHKAALS